MTAAGLLALALAGAALQPPPEKIGDIRIGLADEAPAARISAASPFTLRAGELRIEAREILVSPETAPGVPVLALGSYPSREAAREAERLLRGESRESPTRPPAPLADREQRTAPTRIRRDPETGRYLVILGDPADARALRAAGFLQAGSYPLPTPEGEALIARPTGGLPIRIPAGTRLEITPGAGFLEWEGDPYRGTFTIFRAGEGVTVVNRLPLEEYLRGVVPRELPPDLFPEPEALKAQALVARTYALRPRPVWQERGYDLCAGPRCQVYGGVAAEHPATSAAISATAGEVLTHGGRLADALYTAACGGHTENAENVFTTPTPYLVARDGFRKADGLDLESSLPLVPWDAALAALAGALPPDWALSLDEPAAPEEAAEALAATLDWLGFPVCAAEPSGPRLDQYAGLVADLRCRPGDRVRFRSSALDRLLGEGLLDASEKGANPARPVTRREVISTAGALIGRESALLVRGQVRKFDGEEIVIEPDRPASEDIRLRPATGLRLFREVRPLRIPGRPDPAVPPIPERGLRLRPGDFVRHRPVSEEGAVFDLLVLEDRGETWDRFSPQSAWLVPRDNADLSRSLRDRYPDEEIGEVVALDPLERGASGRISRLRIRGDRGSLEVRGLEVRRALGLADTLFYAEPRRDRNGRVKSWWFTGRGWGHGLGLCQAGAYGMAAHGFDYREILAHSYPETRVETIR